MDAAANTPPQRQVPTDKAPRRLPRPSVCSRRKQSVAMRRDLFLGSVLLFINLLLVVCLLFNRNNKKQSRKWYNQKCSFITLFDRRLVSTITCEVSRKPATGSSSSGAEDVVDDGQRARVAALDGAGLPALRALQPLPGPARPQRPAPPRQDPQSPSCMSTTPKQNPPLTQKVRWQNLKV